MDHHNGCGCHQSVFWLALPGVRLVVCTCTVLDWLSSTGVLTHTSNEGERGVEEEEEEEEEVHRGYPTRMGQQSEEEESNPTDDDAREVLPPDALAVEQDLHADDGEDDDEAGRGVHPAV
jgi:hypothetical protein